MQDTTTPTPQGVETIRSRMPSVRIVTTPADEIDVRESHPFAPEMVRMRTMLSCLQLLITECAEALEDHAEDDDCDGECVMCDAAYSMQHTARLWAAHVEAGIDTFLEAGRGQADIIEARRLMGLPPSPDDPTPTVAQVKAALDQARPVLAPAAELPPAKSRPYWLS